MDKSDEKPMLTTHQAGGPTVEPAPAGPLEPEPDPAFAARAAVGDLPPLTAKRLPIAPAANGAQEVPGQMPVLPQVASEAMFASYFAKAQSEFGPIKRTREVVVTPRDTQRVAYRFRYAPLDVILAAVLPALNKHGFSLTQSLGGEGGTIVVTTLSHYHGSRANKVPMFIAAAGPQSYNSALTYARRAGVTLLLCIAAEDDDDANEAEGNDHEHRDVKPMPNAFPLPRTSGPQKGKKDAQQPAAERPRRTDEEELSREHMRAIAAPGAPPAAFPLNRTPLEGPTNPREQEKIEGEISDAIQELIEAAAEGRRVGIEQIWDEHKSNEYVAQEIWNRLKERQPDLFAVVKAVLKPEPSAPRGPAPKAEEPAKPAAKKQGGK